MKRQVRSEVVKVLQNLLRRRSQWVFGNKASCFVPTIKTVFFKHARDCFLTLTKFLLCKPNQTSTTVMADQKTIIRIIFLIMHVRGTNDICIVSLVMRKEKWD